jgi:LysR family cys regulon transcriptional activator
MVMLAADHLFPVQTTRLAVRRSAYLRGFDLTFIQLFCPHITREDLRRLSAGGAATFEI